MLCPDVRECGTVGNYVCKAMRVSATVCADFVDGGIYSLSVSYQSSMMSATKPAKVYSVSNIPSTPPAKEGYLILYWD